MIINTKVIYATFWGLSAFFYGVSFLIVKFDTHITIKICSFKTINSGF